MARVLSDFLGKRENESGRVEKILEFFIKSKEAVVGTDILGVIQQRNEAREKIIELEYEIEAYESEYGIPEKGDKNYGEYMKMKKRLGNLKSYHAQKAEVLENVGRISGARRRY